MAVRKILTMGNPLLREKSRKLKKNEFATPWLEQLISDMRETMQAAGGIGLAAPQIGEMVQVAIIEIEEGKKRYKNQSGQPFEVFINPKIEYLTNELWGNWEGCLSVPGLRGYVERPAKVRVEYFDISGKKKEIITDSFLAIVLQHELDHLFGTIYVDRLNDTKLLVFEDQLSTFLEGNPQFED
jgi:peptide deformylase